MSKYKLRRHLSMPGLLTSVRQVFNTVPDPVNNRGFTLTNCLMSGLAVFLLKCPSLLNFDQITRGPKAEPPVVRNLRTLFKIDKVPSDTNMRARLDPVDPKAFRLVFNKLFALLQRGRALDFMTMLGGHYLLSIDGTQYYSSSTLKCDHCCHKNHRNGTTTYYHQMLGGAFVHPDIKNVFPVAPEMIYQHDGHKKNDCELNASVRFMEDFRRDHPHLKTIILGDGLTSNGPNIKLLKTHNLRFILVAKPGNHKALFDWTTDNPALQKLDRKERSKNKTITHEFRWLNDVPLNDANFNLEVNVLHYTETKPGTKGKEPTTTNWTWVTDLPLDEGNVKNVMRAARTRWKIENETYQTLKSEAGNGYRLEHNFGHGQQNLSHVFAYLAMLAFYLDQIVQHCCGMAQRAHERYPTKKYLWEAMRRIFTEYYLDSWETFYRGIYEKRKRVDMSVLLAEP